MRDPWTEPRGAGIEDGRWVWVGQGKAVVGKWRQLYSYINKKRKENIYKGGQKEVYSCEYVKHRVYSHIIIYLLLHYLLLLHCFIYWFERARERKKGREKHQFVVPHIHTFTSCFLYVPWLGIEFANLGYQDNAPGNWDTQAWLLLLLFYYEATFAHPCISTTL